MSRQGFSLIEMIVGVIIVVIISSASWTVISMLTKFQEAARQKSIAINLVQKSQEELKRIVNQGGLFDTFASCSFRESQGEVPRCGFVDTTVDYTEFSRDITITNENGQSELKRALITVNWNEFGQARQINSVVFVSRPPDPPPGNLLGQVTANIGGNPLIEGVKISLTEVNTSEGGSQVSLGALTAKDVNYDFADNGRLVLDPGTYQLTASHSDYFPFPPEGQNELVTISSSFDGNEGTRYDFQMESRPEDATIIVNLIDEASGLPVAFVSDSKIQLYEEGVLYRDAGNTGTFVVDDISFEDTSEMRNFTVATDNAFSSGYVGNFTCQAFASVYADGWSSAIVNDSVPPEIVDCAAPREGNDASDRLTVDAVNNKSLTVTVPLQTVPMATLQGFVRDANGAPVAVADFFMRWPSSVGGQDWLEFPIRNVITDSSTGAYRVQVPAVQELFANNNAFYLQTAVLGQVSIQRCCNSQDSIMRLSQNWPTIVGPLRAGQVVTQDYVISVEKEECGDVEGTIRDARAGVNIAVNTTVEVGISVNTADSPGISRYEIECPEGFSGFRLPADGYQFTSSNPTYYTNASAGNFWYRPRADVFVQANQRAVYDALMWPRGFGTYTVTVVSQGNGQPIGGARVNFQPYFSAGSQEGVTDGNGQVIFANVPETWPAAGIDTAYFQENERRHQIQVTHSEYESQTVQTPVLNAGQNVPFQVQLLRSQSGGL